MDVEVQMAAEKPRCQACGDYMVPHVAVDLPDKPIVYICWNCLPSGCFVRYPVGEIGKP